MTIGAETRKAKVTPSGTPASTKPMKSGTAEQEQKGVMMPNPRRPRAPTTTLRPASVRRTRSGETKERRKPTTVTTPDEEQHHLGQVEEEERQRGAEAARRVEAEDVGREPVDGRCEQDPGDEPRGDSQPRPASQNGGWTRRSASVVIRGSRRAPPVPG